MNPADACRAFQDIIEIEQKTPAEVAKRFGLTERFVLGRLRLANLAEPVFEALRDEQITIEVATAYASTSDTDRQASVFARMAGSYYGTNIGEIRRLLASGSYKGGDPKALLVGREAYQAEGGRIDSDLFSDSASETWLDGDLLSRLAQARLEASAVALRERDGFAEVRTVTTSHPPYAEICQLRRLRGMPRPLSPDAEARKAAIDAELDAIKSVAVGPDDYSEEQADRIAALEEECEALTDTGDVISDEERIGAIAYLVLDAEGRPQLHEAFFAAPAVEEEPASGESRVGPDDAVQAADQPAGAEDPKYSQRLSDELAMMKTEILAAHIAADPAFARDLGIFLLVDSATRTRGTYDVPSEIRAHPPTPRVPGFDSATPAAGRWGVLDQALDRSWINHGDAIGRYDGFCALDETARAAWFAWVVARTLQSAPPGSRAEAFLDHVGHKLAIDVASWWRPTARTFVDRISKTLILALFGEVGGADLKNRHAALRKFDLAAAAEKLFSGESIVEPEVKERALAWLPAAMRFDKAGLESADEAVGQDASVSADPDEQPAGREGDLSEPLSEAA